MIEFVDIVIKFHQPTQNEHQVGIMAGDFVQAELRRKLETVDLTEIDFPTNQISLEFLRKRFPKQFRWRIDQANNYLSSFPFDRVDNAIHYEHRIAIAAICVAKDIDLDKVGLADGAVSRNPNDLLEDLERVLHEEYLSLGISDSIETTRQLVGKIKMQAVSLAATRSL